MHSCNEVSGNKGKLIPIKGGRFDEYKFAGRPSFCGEEMRARNGCVAHTFPKIPLHT